MSEKLPSPEAEPETVGETPEGGDQQQRIIAAEEKAPPSEEDDDSPKGKYELKVEEDIEGESPCCTMLACCPCFRIVYRYFGQFTAAERGQWYCNNVATVMKTLH